MCEEYKMEGSSLACMNCFPYHAQHTRLARDLLHVAKLLPIYKEKHV